MCLNTEQPATRDKGAAPVRRSMQDKRRTQRDRYRINHQCRRSGFVERRGGRGRETYLRGQQSTGSCAKRRARRGFCCCCCCCRHCCCCRCSDSPPLLVLHSVVRVTVLLLLVVVRVTERRRSLRALPRPLHLRVCIGIHVYRGSRRIRL